MEVFIFNILRYFLFCLFLISGVIIMQIPLSRSKKYIYDKVYWLACLLPLLLYSFMEGTRWKRGVDYMYNYNIANNIVKSGDIVYDTYALILYKLGISWVFFFVSVSFLLIFSIFLYAKLFHKAFIPIVFFVYAFSMQQSENLMRQYAAISFVLISLYFVLNKKYLFSAIVFVLSFYTHSSSLFIVPFIITAFVCYKYNSNFLIIKRLKFIFLILYIIAPYLSYLLTNYVGNALSLLGETLSVKYLGEDYLDNAIAVSDDGGYLKSVASNSILDNLRTNIRNIFVIFVGGNILSKRCSFYKKNIAYLGKSKIIIYGRQNLFLFLTWFLACCGIIYIQILPDFSMEVMYRLSLYLCLFEYYIEGVLIYFFLKNINKRREKQIVRWGFIFLVISECVWIFRWWENGCGSKFIWLQ